MHSQTNNPKQRLLSNFFFDSYPAVLIRKNLFLKILFIACILNLFSMGITILMAVTSSSGPVARIVERVEKKRQELVSQGIHLYATPLIEKWVIQGKIAAVSYADQMEKHLSFDPNVFDSDGHSLIDRKAPPWVEGRIKQFMAGNHSEFHANNSHGLIVIHRMEGPDRKQYVASGSLKPLKKISYFSPNFAFRIGISFLMITLLSFLLTRHIANPIAKLRKATREIAAGNFSFRVGEMLGRRQDAIAQLGLDFDQMATQIQTLIKDRQRLFRDISHELRSPLARLSISLEISRQKASDEVTSNLDRIGLEAERINNLIGEILLLSRLETGPIFRTAEMIDLSGMICRIGDDANFEAQGRQVSVIIAPSPVFRIYGYPQILHRAIENVVRNAIRYTDKGTAVNIGIEAGSANKDHIILTIRDHGPGVPLSALPHLFEPFYRAKGDRGRKTGGTGVGLAIAYRAIKLHKGEIRAENIPNGGLQVTITLLKTANAA